jgi:hypothetical protein
MPGIRVDGNDVLAVYRVCREAIERARKGEGPTLVESVTYRIASHSSSDDAARYRDAAEFERWKQRDPILRFQKYLQKKSCAHSKARNPPIAASSRSESLRILPRGTPRRITAGANPAVGRVTLRRRPPARTDHAFLSQAHSLAHDEIPAWHR